MKQLIASFVACAGLAAVAAPAIDPASVTISQDPDTKLVNIGYTLSGEPAIVTVDIRTNGTSIGGSNLQFFRGAVNRLVTNLSENSITWDVRKAWPGHKLDDGVTAVVTAWPTNTPPDYMVVDLLLKNTVHFYASKDEVPYGITNSIYKTEKMAFRKIPASHVTWRMGSGSGQGWTEHEVTLSSDFWMAVYMLTGAQRDLLNGGALTTSTEAAYPYKLGDARGGAWPGTARATDGSLAGKLRLKLGGGDFDVPLEAQWEFACRAGAYGGMYYAIDGSGNLYKPSISDVAVTKEGSVTQAVGTLVPNAFGLYDMLGLHWEICRDNWNGDYSPSDDPEVGPTSGTRYVLRGGSYHTGTWDKNCGYRTQAAASVWDDVPGIRFSCAVGSGEAR